MQDYDINDSTETFINPDKEGWLLKQGGWFKSWKRRWFVLQNHCLYYFVSPVDKEPRGIIPLENIQVSEANEMQKPNGFKLYTSDNEVIKACKIKGDKGKYVEGKHMVYRISASTAEEQQDWIKFIRRSTRSSKFYSDVLEIKKRHSKVMQAKKTTLTQL